MSKIVALSEASAIAMHAIVIVAQSETKVNVLQIAEMMHSSRHHVAKIMQRMVKEGFVSSVRGPSGGFELKVAADEITFLDIYEAIEGKIIIDECPMNKPSCPFDHCIYDNVTNEMTVKFKDYLQSQTIEMHMDNRKIKSKKEQ